MTLGAGLGNMLRLAAKSNVQAAKTVYSSTINSPNYRLTTMSKTYS